jgi:16S rRNA (adenine1518-N6/adenine1519-N6)-dimethyltransferase
MPIYQPSQLRQFLEEHGFAPRKGLSQNFLIDGNILKKIVAAAQVEPGDLVLEIGPGPGALTEELLACGARIVAVEMDEGFARVLPRLDQEGRLEVFCNDIMKFPVSESVMARLEPGKRAKLIANLPYHLTTPILADFVVKDDQFSLLTVMVQDEVARRLTAQAKSSEYSSLTVFRGFYADVSYDFKVSRHCFYPQPKVDSAVVTLRPRKPPLPPKEAEGFFMATRTAFEHRRKMLRGSLSELYAPDAIEKALVACGLDARSRPEELSLDQWLLFYAKLQ